MRYRSRPVEVDAIRWTGDNIPQVASFGGTVRWPGWRNELELWCGQDGQQGWVSVPVGHWIVRRAGDHSDHWPVEDDHFTTRYDPTE